MLTLPGVDVVIVNWNAGRQLCACLRSVLQNPASCAVASVIVVDNASTDASLQEAEKVCPEARIVRNRQNRGFGAASNQGAAVGAADYLLFLNPDARLADDSLSAALQFMERAENRGVGVCGIQLVNEEGEVSRTCARFPTPGSLFHHLLGLDRILPLRFPSHFMAEWDHGTTGQVDHVIGAFYLIRRELFEALDGFDERFFVYMEDLDLSRRVQGAGYSSVYLATCRAYHKGGGTSEQVRAARLFYSLRSRIQYGYKHFAWWAATAVALGTLLIEPPIRIGHALLRGSPRGVAETLSGYTMLWTDLVPRALARVRR